MQSANIEARFVKSDRFDLDAVLNDIAMYACGKYEGTAGDVNLSEIEASYTRGVLTKVRLCIVVDTHRTLDKLHIAAVCTACDESDKDKGYAYDVFASANFFDKLEYHIKQRDDISPEQGISAALRHTLDILG